MKNAAIIGIISLCAGICACFLKGSFGIVISLSIIGAGIIYELEQMKSSKEWSWCRLKFYYEYKTWGYVRMQT